MHDNASLAVGGPRSGLGGLPQRLVQDGVVDEAAMLEAVNAARERKTSVVTQLVSSGAANARDIAVAASNEFGVPLFDLDSVNLDPEVVRGVESMGYVDPTPIQLRAFPVILEGKDMMGSAQTGTGKTAAFALPLLTMLGEHGKLRALILELTRELAQ